MRLVFGMRRVEGGKEKEGERWSGIGCHHPSQACESYGTTIQDKGGESEGQVKEQRKRARGRKKGHHSPVRRRRPLLLQSRSGYKDEEEEEAELYLYICIPLCLSISGLRVVTTSCLARFIAPPRDSCFCVSLHRKG
jgi:hypothetical protein